jgi:hypothetical protein
VGSPHISGPHSITGLEIDEYKFALVRGCIDQTLGKGETAEVATGESNCTLHTLETGLSHEDWQRATYAAQNRQVTLEEEILGRYGKQFETCRNGIRT